MRTNGRILVTGGAGFIGRAFARAQLSRGAEVVLLDSLSRQVHGESPREELVLGDLLGRVEFIRGDVRDSASLDRAVRGVSVVVHLAAETGTGQSMYEVSHYFDTNVMGTAKLLEAISRAGARPRLLVASSRAIYGEGMYRSESGAVFYPEQRSNADLERGVFEPLDPFGRPGVVVPTSEEAPPRSCSVYGISKFSQEQQCLAFCRAHGLDGVALRFQNVYGPGQSLKNPYTGILSIFSSLLLDGKPIRVFEDGEESRDFVYIDDVVDAMCAALTVELKSPSVFNVGTGVGVSVARVAGFLKDFYGSNSKIEITGEFRVGDVRHCVADTSKARAVLGFEARTDFETGVRRFGDWVLGQERTHVEYERSLNEMAGRGLLGRAAQAR